jgi:hypothetical protein
VIRGQRTIGPPVERRKMFEKLKTIKRQMKARIEGNVCPHCGKEIVFDIQLQHNHTFNYQVDTTNKVLRTTISKPNVSKS